MARKQQPAPAADSQRQRAPRGSGSRWTDAQGRYHIRVTYQGVKLEVAESDPARAESVLLDKKAEVDRDIQHQLDRDGSRLTLTDFADDYLDYVKASHKASTQRADRQLVELYITPTLGSYRLRDLRSSLIQRWLDKLVAVVAHSTVKKSRSLLQRMLARACVLDYIEANPVVNVITPPPRKDRPTRQADPLTCDEVRTVLAVAGVHPQRTDKRGRTQLLSTWRDLCVPIWLGLLGLRRGEVLGLQRDDVDLTGKIPSVTVRRDIEEIDGELLVDTPKTEESGRVVPLPPALVTLLRPVVLRCQTKTTWLFRSKRGTVLRPQQLYKNYRTVLVRAKVTPRRFHDLRHTAGATLVDLGCPERISAALLGHAPASVTGKYSRPALATVAMWVDKLAEAYLVPPKSDAEESTETGS